VTALGRNWLISLSGIEWRGRLWFILRFDQTDNVVKCEKRTEWRFPGHRILKQFVATVIPLEKQEFLISL
jgi:hypothetical protein